jgi:hypothetical protein
VRSTVVLNEKYGPPQCQKIVSRDDLICSPLPSRSLQGRVKRVPTRIVIPRAKQHAGVRRGFSAPLRFLKYRIAKRRPAGGTREERHCLTASQFSASVLGGACSATWTSWQGFDECVDQADAHGRNRVRNVTFRPQGRIPWVGNRRVRQLPGAARRYEVLRGESSPARRSGIRKLRCTSSRDDGSRASRALRSG